MELLHGESEQFSESNLSKVYDIEDANKEHWEHHIRWNLVLDKVLYYLRINRKFVEFKMKNILIFFFHLIMRVFTFLVIF